MQLTLSTTHASISNVSRPLYSMTGQGIGPSKVLTSTCLMINE